MWAVSLCPQRAAQDQRAADSQQHLTRTRQLILQHTGPAGLLPPLKMLQAYSHCPLPVRGKKIMHLIFWKAWLKIVLYYWLKTFFILRNTKERLTWENVCFTSSVILSKVWLQASNEALGEQESWLVASPLNTTLGLDRRDRWRTCTQRTKYEKAQGHTGSMHNNKSVKFHQWKKQYEHKLLASSKHIYLKIFKTI